MKLLDLENQTFVVYILIGMLVVAFMVMAVI